MQSANLSPFCMVVKHCRKLCNCCRCHFQCLFENDDCWEQDVISNQTLIKPQVIIIIWKSHSFIFCYVTKYLNNAIYFKSCYNCIVFSYFRPPVKPCSRLLIVIAHVPSARHQVGIGLILCDIVFILIFHMNLLRRSCDCCCHYFPRYVRDRDVNPGYRLKCCWKVVNVVVCDPIVLLSFVTTYV